MFSNLKNKTIKALSYFFILSSIFMMFPQKQTDAIIGVTFGGNITSSFFCACSANVILTIGPPSPAVLTYEPGGSILYPFWQIYRPGPFMLGEYYPSTSACLIYVVVGCAPIPTQGMISMTGTSL